MHAVQYSRVYRTLLTCRPSIELSHHLSKYLPCSYSLCFQVASAYCSCTLALPGHLSHTISVHTAHARHTSLHCSTELAYICTSCSGSGSPLSPALAQTSCRCQFEIANHLAPQSTTFVQTAQQQVCVLSVRQPSLSLPSVRPPQTKLSGCFDQGNTLCRS